jgi:hypothetical protein
MVWQIKGMKLQVQESIEEETFKYLKENNICVLLYLIKCPVRPLKSACGEFIISIA